MSAHIDIDDKLNELEAKLATTKAQLCDLATMGAIITSIHEINAVLSVVMDMAIRLADGEVGLIMLEEDGQLKVKIGWGVSEEFVHSLIYQDGMDLPSYCFKIRETIVLNNLGVKDDSGFSIESIICLPIKTAEKCHGVLMIINKVGAGEYDEEDRESLEMFLNFVAVAIDNAILLKDKLKQQKVAQEMVIAKQIQETILPQDVDAITGAEIGAVYYPAREVGGDFYNIFKLDDERFMVVIGDVSNKGVPAALVMSAASGIISSLLSTNPNITVSELVECLNNLLANEIIKDREMFVTLFFGRFDLESSCLTYCNGGHLPGLLWDAEKQKICELAEGGPIVGQFAEIPFKQGHRHLGSGDRLLLFTDGLTEAADVDNNLFSFERVGQVFTTEIELPPKEFCMKVKQTVDRFAEGAPEETRDDFTVLQIKVN